MNNADIDAGVSIIHVLAANPDWRAHTLAVAAARRASQNAADARDVASVEAARAQMGPAEVPAALLWNEPELGQLDKLKAKAALWARMTERMGWR